jgi:hypothetical protein
MNTRKNSEPLINERGPVRDAAGMQQFCTRQARVRERQVQLIFFRFNLFQNIYFQKIPVLSKNFLSFEKKFTF